MSIDVQAAKARLQSGIKAGVQDAVNALYEAAIPLTPLGETGNLRNNTHITLSIADGTAFAQLNYNMIYAARQHEETSWNHPRAGQAKFLEVAAKQREDHIKRIIAAHIRTAL